MDGDIPKGTPPFSAPRQRGVSLLGLDTLAEEKRAEKEQKGDTLNDFESDFSLSLTFFYAIS
jgi:hypothetical protein